MAEEKNNTFEFDNVLMDVDFETAEKSELLTPKENISQAFGKIDRFMRDTQISSQKGNQIEQKNDGWYVDNKIIDIEHGGTGGAITAEARQNLRTPYIINCAFSGGGAGYYKICSFEGRGSWQTLNVSLSFVPIYNDIAGSSFVPIHGELLLTADNKTIPTPPRFCTSNCRFDDPSSITNQIFVTYDPSDALQGWELWYLAKNTNFNSISVIIHSCVSRGYDNVRSITPGIQMALIKESDERGTPIGSIDRPNIVSLQQIIESDTKTYIDTKLSILESQFKQHSWQEVQRIVRAGFAADVFPLGYEFTTPDSDTGIDIVWRVVAHDHHKAANENLKHTMTLEMKNVYCGSDGAAIFMQAGSTKALYCAEEGLEVGTYNFIVANQAWYTADNGKSFQFTLTKAVPAGGQIILENPNANVTFDGRMIRTVASSSSIDAIEIVALSEGNNGEVLGTTNGTGNMNHVQGSFYGQNNYAQCALRQWLNSAEKVGSVWQPQTKFDRPPIWANKLNGFLHGLPKEFLEVVQPAIIPCGTGSLYEVNSLDGTAFTTNQRYDLEDKFFACSLPEIYGKCDNQNYKDGELLAYYEGATDIERIKYDENGTADIYWLRSPVSGTVRMFEAADRTGVDRPLSSEIDNGVAVSAACIIA